MNGHEVIWTRPPSLVAGAAAKPIALRGDAFQSPAILRFTTDTFMDDVLALLDSSPERLTGYLVRRETWRGFAPAPEVEPAKPASFVLERLGIVRRRLPQAASVDRAPTRPAPAVPAETPLKLYQPGHQRHYLVACSLVCDTVGLPDRLVDGGRGEAASWVLRRLLPPAGGDDTAPLETWEEHGWVARGQGYGWQRVGADPRQVLDAEERLPLFALQYREQKRRRRLFAGVIPVGKRETYLGAPKASAPGTGAHAGLAPGTTPRTARKILFRKEVVEPWKSLVRRAQEVQAALVPGAGSLFEPPTDRQRIERLRIEREHIQTVSWFVLLDFAKFLATHLKPVWRAVLDPAQSRDLNPPERELFEALDEATLTLTLRSILRRRSEVDASGDILYALGDVPGSLRAALARFGAPPDGVDLALERRLDAIDQAYDRYDAGSRALWPGFLFPLADPGLPNDVALPTLVPVRLTEEERAELELDENPVALDPLERLDRLAVLAVRALRDDDPEPAPQPAVPLAAIPPANALEGWFVIRCVYDRPGCAPVHPAAVSEPTERFQMAGFFDPDAPARPVRIGLPIDTTPGGLRKFDKNTAFVISDTLCGQIRRLKGLTLGDLVLSVLPWPLHKDLPVDSTGGPCRSGADALGMMCSLSIPIVTICALILLMIMVSLLDMIFRWLPYFIICFPLPGLKAKPQSPS